MDTKYVSLVRGTNRTQVNSVYWSIALWMVCKSDVAVILKIHEGTWFIIQVSMKIITKIWRHYLIRHDSIGPSHLLEYEPRTPGIQDNVPLVIVSQSMFHWVNLATFMIVAGLKGLLELFSYVEIIRFQRLYLFHCWAISHSYPLHAGDDKRSKRTAPQIHNKVVRLLLSSAL